MPPKKSEKALAAELKKKNTNEAREIVASLQRKQYVEDATAASKPKKDVNSKFNEITSLFAVDLVAADGVAKRSDGAVTRSDGAVTRSDGVAKHIGPPPKRVKDSQPVKSKKRRTNDEKSESKRSSRKSNVQNVTKVASVSKTSNENSVQPAKTSKGPVAEIGRSKTFYYEINCMRVCDSINVIDLKNHLKKHLKVNDKKNNLDDNVTVTCQDQKVVINSKVFLPKRSLRFLSKKFLKKAWNIQVLSKNKNSYEFKYVGTR